MTTRLRKRQMEERKMGKATVTLYRQLPAGEVYCHDQNWRRLEDSFNEEQRSGIYFYSYQDADVPFYIGKCNAKSYKIVGRVWQELDDYKQGKYWLAKDLSQLATLSCFRAENQDKTEFHKPGDQVPEEVFQRFLDSVYITFATVTGDGSIEEMEALLQKHVVKSRGLQPKWIGDGGMRLSGADGTAELSVEIIISPDPNAKGQISRLNFLNVFRKGQILFVD